MPQSSNEDPTIFSRATNLTLIRGEESYGLGKKNWLTLIKEKDELIKNSKDLKSAAILSILEDKYVKTILFEICYSHLELQPNFLRKLKNSFRNWATGFSLKVSECSEYSNDSHHNCNTAFIIIANLVRLLLGTHFWQAIMLQGKIDGIRFKEQTYRCLKYVMFALTDFVNWIIS